jgi:hypothetical protein
MLQASPKGVQQLIDPTLWLLQPMQGLLWLQVVTDVALLD